MLDYKNLKMPSPVLQYDKGTYDKLRGEIERQVKDEELREEALHLFFCVQNLHKNFDAKLREMLKVYNQKKALPHNIYFEPKSTAFPPLRDQQGNIVSNDGLRVFNNVYIHHIDMYPMRTLAITWDGLLRQYHEALEYAINEGQVEQISNQTAGCFEESIFKMYDWSKSKQQKDEEKTKVVGQGKLLEAEDAMEILSKGISLIPEASTFEYAEDVLGALKKIIKMKEDRPFPDKEVLELLMSIYSYESKPQEKEPPKIAVSTNEPPERVQEAFKRELKKYADMDIKLWNGNPLLGRKLGPKTNENIMKRSLEVFEKITTLTKENKEWLKNNIPVPITQLGTEKHADIAPTSAMPLPIKEAHKPAQQVIQFFDNFYTNKLNLPADDWQTEWGPRTEENVFNMSIQRLKDLKHLKITPEDIAWFAENKRAQPQSISLSKKESEQLKTEEEPRKVGEQSAVKEQQKAKDEPKQSATKIQIDESVPEAKKDRFADPRQKTKKEASMQPPERVKQDTSMKPRQRAKREKIEQPPVVPAKSELPSQKVEISPPDVKELQKKQVSKSQADKPFLSKEEEIRSRKAEDIFQVDKPSLDKPFFSLAKYKLEVATANRTIGGQSIDTLELYTQNSPKESDNDVNALIATLDELDLGYAIFDKNKNEKAFNRVAKEAKENIYIKGDKDIEYVMILDLNEVNKVFKNPEKIEKIFQKKKRELSESRGALLNQIERGVELKKVPNNLPKKTARNALLEDITKGKKLKPVADIGKAQHERVSGFVLNIDLLENVRKMEMNKEVEEKQSLSIASEKSQEAENVHSATLEEDLTSNSRESQSIPRNDAPTMNDWSKVFNEINIRAKCIGDDFQVSKEDAKVLENAEEEQYKLISEAMTFLKPLGANLTDFTDDLNNIDKLMAYYNGIRGGNDDRWRMLIKEFDEFRGIEGPKEEASSIRIYPQVDSPENGEKEKKASVRKIQRPYTPAATQKSQVSAKPLSPEKGSTSTSPTKEPLKSGYTPAAAQKTQVSAKPDIAEKEGVSPSSSQMRTSGSQQNYSELWVKLSQEVEKIDLNTIPFASKFSVRQIKDFVIEKNKVKNPNEREMQGRLGELRNKVQAALDNVRDPAIKETLKKVLDNVPIQNPRTPTKKF